MEIASESAQRIKEKVRALDEKAIQEMKKYGLEIYTPKKSEIPEWEGILTRNFYHVRDKLMPAEIFDQVIKLRNDFRSKKNKK